MKIDLDTPLSQLNFTFLKVICEEVFLYFEDPLQSSRTGLDSPCIIRDLVKSSGLHPDHVLQKLKLCIKAEKTIFLSPKSLTGKEVLFDLSLGPKELFTEPCTVPPREPSNAFFWHEIEDVKTFLQELPPNTLKVFTGGAPDRAYSAALYFRFLGFEDFFALSRAASMPVL